MAEEQKLNERVAVVETHVEFLVGNGQPGKVKQLEDELRGLIAAHNQGVGRRHVITMIVSAIVSTIVTALGFYITRHLR